MNVTQFTDPKRISCSYRSNVGARDGPPADGDAERQRTGEQVD